MSTPPKKITVREIAARAQVSAATVSLVLQGKGNLRAQTRDAVMRVIEETGYQPRRPAIKGASGKLFALIVDDIANPYFHELFKGLNTTLEQDGHYVSMLDSGDSVTRQTALLTDLWASEIGGVVLVAATGTGRADLSLFENRKRPLIMAVRQTGRNPFDYVGANPLVGMQLATDHFIRLNYKDIGFIGGFKANHAYRERYAGFVSSLMGHDLHPDHNKIIAGGSNRKFGFEAVQKLLRSDSLPEALIAYNDLVALGAMDALRADGRVPGRDIGIIGYDDIPEAALQAVPLTSIATPAHELGKVIGQVLLSHTRGQKNGTPLDVTYAPRLIVRQSCGAENRANEQQAPTPHAEDSGLTRIAQ